MAIWLKWTTSSLTHACILISLMTNQNRFFMLFLWINLHWRLNIMSKKKHKKNSTISICPKRTELLDLSSFSRPCYALTGWREKKSFFLSTVSFVKQICSWFVILSDFLMESCKLINWVMLNSRIERFFCCSLRLLWLGFVGFIIVFLGLLMKVFCGFYRVLKIHKFKI